MARRVRRWCVSCSAAAVLLVLVAAGVGPASTTSGADGTPRSEISGGPKHDLTLGATGARGWIQSDKMVTSDAREIVITEVAEGSPAAGVLAVGDVILGIGEREFSCDPRTEFGKALTQAESKAGGGLLSLLLRREGATLRRRLAELPDGVEASRRLLVAHARTAAYAGRPTEAEALLDAAATTAPDRDERFEPSIDRVASPLATLDPTTALMRAFVAHLRGDIDEAVALATEALENLPDDGSAAALIAQLHLATGPWMRGAVDQAIPALETNVERWRALGQPERVAFACHHLARAHCSRDRNHSLSAGGHSVSG